MSCIPSLHNILPEFFTITPETDFESPFISPEKICEHHSPDPNNAPYFKEGCLYEIMNIFIRALAYIPMNLFELCRTALLGLDKVSAAAEDNCGQLIATITTLFCDLVAIPFAALGVICFWLGSGFEQADRCLFTAELV